MNIVCYAQLGLHFSRWPPMISRIKFLQMSMVLALKPEFRKGDYRTALDKLYSQLGSQARAFMNEKSCEELAEE